MKELSLLLSSQVLTRSSCANFHSKMHFGLIRWKAAPSESVGFRKYYYIINLASLTGISNLYLSTQKQSYFRISSIWKSTFLLSFYGRMLTIYTGCNLARKGVHRLRSYSYWSCRKLCWGHCRTRISFINWRTNVRLLKWITTMYMK